MYDGQAPAAGVVTGIARIAGRPFMVIANDATVASGAFFPMTAKKVIRNQTIALECRLPTIYLVDSAGVNLPMQDEVFPDQDDFGRVFRNNAVMSAHGVPQIAAIMGMCVAGGAYLPVMCDTVLMTEGSGLFLAGPDLVAKAVGKKFTAEEIGGAKLHAEVSGTVDFHEKDDPSCLKRIQALAASLGHPPPPVFRRDPPVPPRFDAEDVSLRIVPSDPLQEYDVREVIARLVDASAFTEYRATYGKTITCCFARIDGWSVGIVASNGVLFSESALKGAHFVELACARRIPLLFLQNITGFMVGKQYEAGGIAKDGAKLVTAVACAEVPKFTVVIGGSFGAGNYAMCGRAYSPRQLWTWPNARISVMGGEQAATVLSAVGSADPAEIRAKYEREGSPYYATARLWDDGILDPLDTRPVIAMGISAALNAPIPETSFGVFRM